MWKKWSAAVFASFSTFGLLLTAQPPHNTPETAFVFLLPALIWLSFKPKISNVFWTFLISGFFYHICLIWWMRHISYGGLIMASVLQSFYLLPWFLVARMMINYGLSQSFLKRFFFLITLPAVWVSIEWLRCQFTLGFPWCPLSVTQWERPIILQALAWCGAWSLSFFLIFFNLCIGSYLHHLLVRRRLVRSGVFSSFCPDFYLGIIFFLLLLAPFFYRIIVILKDPPKNFEWEFLSRI